MANFPQEGQKIHTSQYTEYHQLDRTDRLQGELSEERNTFLGGAVSMVMVVGSGAGWLLGAGTFVATGEMLVTEVLAAMLSWMSALGFSAGVGASVVPLFSLSFVSLVASLFSTGVAVTVAFTGELADSFFSSSFLATGVCLDLDSLEEGLEGFM